MSNLEIEIRKMIQDMFSVPINSDEEFADFELTGDRIGLDECDLVYLLAAIERQYKIIIPTDMLGLYAFNSIHGICETIRILLSKKDANQM
ncbi:MAG: hypothetical protein HFH39_09495 [Lachnospiraceae bacterium]|nr:hypothetical protein [Lachnospiraceae bacterium]